ncbi:MAG: DEAD/DEAH box helicase, partial [Anaerolineae bacterium]|nr:DEAD/DEAH box helicase [Anaerolineae bacterium]
MNDTLDTITFSTDLAQWMRRSLLRRSMLRRSQRDSFEVWKLRLRAEQARLSNGFDQLICLDDIFIDQYPYQLDAALKALRDMRGRALLADEVGLGKTIEAGIVMKELIERGLAQRILVLTPASLTVQWQEELETKFVEPFEVLERRRQIDDPPDGPLRWICSLDRAKRADWAEGLLAREYDLLIVDEAHKLKNRGTQVYRFVNQIRKRYVLLLTATPVHNDLIELYNLITILQPGHLGTLREFRRRFVGGVRRRVLLWSTRSLNLEYYWRQYRSWLRRLRWTKENLPGFELSHLAMPAQPTPAKMRKQHQVVEEQDIPTGQAALAQAQDLVAQGYRISESLVVTNPYSNGTIGFRLVFELLESDPTLPRNAPELRRLLGEVMIRNRRAHVGVQLPLRRARVFDLDLSPEERALYDGITAYVRGQIRRIGAGAQQMTLLTLQRQVCSSPAAVAGTLRKLARNTQYDTEQHALDRLIALAENIEQPAKIDAVLRILEGSPGQWLIFTDYRATMDSLSEALREAGIDVVCFHGGLSALDKERVVRAFRGEARRGAPRVLISTESGAEGRNLQ